MVGEGGTFLRWCQLPRVDSSYPPIPWGYQLQSTRCWGTPPKGIQGLPHGPVRQVEWSIGRRLQEETPSSVPVRGTPRLPELYWALQRPRHPQMLSQNSLPPGTCLSSGPLENAFHPKPSGSTSWEMNSLGGLRWPLLSQVLLG